jgi:hypothetical protein
MVVVVVAHSLCPAENMAWACVSSPEIPWGGHRALPGAISTRNLVGLGHAVFVPPGAIFLVFALRGRSGAALADPAAAKWGVCVCVWGGVYCPWSGAVISCPIPAVFQTYVYTQRGKFPGVNDGLIESEAGLREGGRCVCVYA